MLVNSVIWGLRQVLLGVAITASLSRKVQLVMDQVVRGFVQETVSIV